jgi:transcriptional regulator with XRE-family HTH domain
MPQLDQQILLNIGANITRARRRQRVKLHLLSQVMNIPLRRLEQIEAAETEVGVDELRRICEYLQMDLIRAFR